MSTKVTKVIKRDGRIVPFDKERIRNAIKKAMMSVNQYDEKTLERILKYVMRLVNEKFDEENIPHVEDIQDIVEFTLVKYDLYEVAKSYILYRKEREKIRKEKMLLLNKEYLDEVDKAFSLNAVRLLAARYLLKDEEGKVIETPKQLFQRVAALIVIPDILYDNRIFSKDGGQVLHETEEFNPSAWEGKVGIGYDPENNSYEVYWNRYHLEMMKDLYDRLNREGKMKVKWSEFFKMLINNEFDNYYENYLEYYNLMVSKKFMPNSPTLFNAGTRLGQLSACFVLKIDDDINSIMQAAKDAAIIFKSGGGIGINYSKLRPEGDMVFSTAGVASGPVSFMRIIDTVTDVIKQGGCISVDNYLYTSIGLVRPDWIPVSNPRVDNYLPFTIYDGTGYIDAMVGSFGSSQEIVEITTEYGHKIRVTYNELIASIDDKGEITFKPVYSLKEGEYLVLVLGEHEGKEIHLEDMGKPHHNSNKVKIPNILNTDLAEILGFYIGDGCWSNGRLILSFSKTEEHLLDYMIKKIKSVFNLKPSEKRSRGNYIDVVWSSKELERYFSKRIWKKNSSTDSFIPADIMMSKKEVLAAFIRGLFEADGYVNNWGHPVLYTTSKSLVSQLQTALLSLGILSTATISKAKNICGHLGSNDVYQIRITDEESIYRFSRLIGFISNEKNLKLKKALNKKFEYIRKIPNVSNILKEIHLEIKKKDKKRAYRFYRKTRKYIYNHRNLTYFRLKRLADEFEELKPLLEKYKRYVFTKITNIKTSRNIVFHLETSSGRYIANGFLVHNKRRGANMGILEIWHPDIEKFITSKSTQGMLENFNISVMITPDFWEKYYNNENYVLKNPRDDRPWKEVNARQLFRLIAENAWKTGDPGVLFLDNINKRNILRKGFGEIKSTNPCVTGDTLVYTPRGIYEIREIVNGVTEICVDDRAILKYQIGKPVGLYRAEGDVVKTGVRPIIKIETEHGLVLKVTPDHKVRIAENLGRTSDGNAYRFRLKWKEAGKLRNGDTLILNSINIWDDWEEEIDGIPLTWKLGYIIGYIMGDGYVNEDSVNMYFDMKKEKDLAEKMRIMIKETLGIDPYIDIKGNKLWLKIHSKKIVNIFRKLGVSIGKSNKREIPRIVFRSPRRFVIGFVTGLWEANGTINISKGKNANIRISSSSQNLLKGLQHILLALGIPSRLYLCRRRYGELSKHTIKNGYKSLYTTREDHILVISKDNIIKMISILDPQGNYKKYKLRELSRINSKRGFYKEYYLSKVVNIENGDIEEVYDILNIPGHHAFVANGIIIHNCGEEPLYPYESCNLGSINLYAFVEYDEEGNRYFNWEEYKRVIKTATRFLDNVIDVNKYPIPKIAEMSRKTRKIGLGLMGLADTLYALKIPYNSEDGFKLMKKFAEHLTYYSMETSIERAIERGTFPAYDLSSYPDGEMPIEGYYDRKEWTLDWNRLHERIRHYGIRNAETTTIAPTGSISMIADTSSGIEPQFALVFEKRVSVGTFFYVDPELERTLHSMGLYNEHILKAIADNGGSLQELEGIPKELKKIFLVAYDIPWWDHVRAQAEISKWICAAVSKTINMPNWVTVDDVEKAFIYAYKIGNKGITIYRDGSKTKQVLVTPSQRKGSYVLNIGNNTLKMMKKMGIEPPIPTKAETKLADRTMKIMMRQTKEGLGDGSKDTAKEYEVCPECGGTNIIYVEACLKCLECGWSLCVTS